MLAADLNRRLDGLESGLPRPASRVLHAQRSALAAAGGVARDALEAVSQVTGAVLGTARDGVKTVIGQGRRSAEVTARTATEQAGAVTGQVAGQRDRVASTLADGVEDLADRAAERLDQVDQNQDQPADDLTGLTRGELLGRARELDIDGRTKMSKAQLVDAIRSAS
jgi:hypothetical protein